MFWDYDYNAFAGRFAMGRWLGSFNVEERSFESSMSPLFQDAEPLVPDAEPLVADAGPSFGFFESAFSHPFQTLTFEPAFVDESATPARNPTFWSFNGNIPFGGDLFFI